MTAQKSSAAKNLLESDVLVAPHHGSKTSSAWGFIDAVKPDLTIFTAGYLNRFRHPVPEVVKRYENEGSRVLRTDYHGAIILDFAGGHAENSLGVVSWRLQNRRYWHDIY